MVGSNRALYRLLFGRCRPPGATKVWSPELAAMRGRQRQPQAPALSS